ncbi:hypothetical protein ABTN75_21330, partial [Acinetobacter baumannii]
LLKAWDKISDTNSIATTLAIDWAAQMNTLIPRAQTQEENTEVIGRLENIAAAVSLELQLKTLQEVINALKKKYSFWEV